MLFAAKMLSNVAERQQEIAQKTTSWTQRVLEKIKKKKFDGNPFKAVMVSESIPFSPAIETRNPGAMTGPIVSSADTSPTPASTLEAAIGDPFSDNQRIIFAVAAVILSMVIFTFIRKKA